MRPEDAQRDEPIFAGDLVVLDGSLPGRNWMVLAFHHDGEWAEIVRVKDIGTVPFGGQPRIVLTSQLRKPSVAPQVKATPGQLYRHQETDQLGVGTKDGCIFDSDSRLIWAFDNHAWQVESDGKR